MKIPRIKIPLSLVLLAVLLASIPVLGILQATVGPDSDHARADIASARNPDPHVR